MATDERAPSTTPGAALPAGAPLSPPAGASRPHLTSATGERVELPPEVLAKLMAADGSGGTVEIDRPDGTRMTVRLPPGARLPAAAAGGSVTLVSRDASSLSNGLSSDSSGVHEAEAPVMYRRTSAERYSSAAADAPPSSSGAADTLADADVDDAIAAAALGALEPGSAGRQRQSRVVAIPEPPAPAASPVRTEAAEATAAVHAVQAVRPPSTIATPAPSETVTPIIPPPPVPVQAAATAPVETPIPTRRATRVQEVTSAEAPSTEMAAVSPPAAEAPVLPAAPTGPSAPAEAPAREMNTGGDHGLGDEGPGTHTSMDRADAANTEMRSEEIDEILTSMPGGLLRWGSTAVFTTLLVLLGITWYIRYPDVVMGRVSLTTLTPPVRVVSHAAGEVARVFVADRTPVHTGDPLLLLKSPADYNDVARLSAALDRLEPALQRAGPLPDLTFDHPLLLGEVQGPYSAFQQAFSDYRTLLADPFYAQKVAALQAQIANLEQLRERLKAQQQLLDEQLALADRNRDRSRQLGTQNLSSSADVDAAEQQYLQQRYAGENGRTATTNNEIQLAAQRSALLDLQQRRADDGQRMLVGLRNAQHSLRGALSAWEQNYLPRSPVSGTASFFRDLHENQFVAAQEPLVAVLPSGGAIVGRVTLAGEGAGKVRIGQRVILHLDNFPYKEYGSVEGRVTRISQLGFEQTQGQQQAFGYQAEVTLPRGLVTTYGRRLAFTQEMRGEVQVVTEDIRLIGRVFNQIRSLREL
ncbi:MAG TPA: HlyD family efflux transporter periplasmic adaptor subunit [Longimicrobiaceae bacterium]|jgi:HlyD family secretion protein|nr:HlyD family efflux transporter periplasmic adaptor subunit [Longimicrobiaceae bacterium]